MVASYTELKAQGEKKESAELYIIYISK